MGSPDSDPVMSATLGQPAELVSPDDVGRHRFQGSESFPGSLTADPEGIADRLPGQGLVVAGDCDGTGQILRSMVDGSLCFSDPFECGFSGHRFVSHVSRIPDMSRCPDTLIDGAGDER